MSQMMQMNGPVVPVKPQANVYTVLIIIAILAMVAAVGTLMNDMMTNYGLAFGEIFSFGS
jgi:hypothetical protein